MQNPKIAKNWPSRHHRTTLLGYIFASKSCIHNRKKNLLNSNISPPCPHNMVNFGPVTAEIRSGVWGTPANFNGFHVLAVLLQVWLTPTTRVPCSNTARHSSSGRQPNSAALNRGRHLYSAGRPPRWAYWPFLLWPNGWMHQDAT